MLYLQAHIPAVLPVIIYLGSCNLINANLGLDNQHCQIYTCPYMYEVLFWLERAHSGLRIGPNNGSNKRHDVVDSHNKLGVKPSSIDSKGDESVYGRCIANRKWCIV